MDIEGVAVAAQDGVVEEDEIGEGAAGVDAEVGDHARMGSVGRLVSMSLALAARDGLRIIPRA